MGSEWGEAQRQCEPAEAETALMLLSDDSCSCPDSLKANSPEYLESIINLTGTS